MMRSFPGLALCGAVFFLLNLSITEIGSGPTAQAQSKSSARAKRVDELFNRNCARCHGPDGRGDTPMGQVFNSPDFTDPKWWSENAKITGTQNLRTIVANGKAGMPAFGKKLSRSEINLLVDRIRRFRK